MVAKLHSSKTGLWRSLAAAVLGVGLAAGCGGGGDDAGDGDEVPVPASVQTGRVAVQDAGSGLPDRWYAKGAFMEINVRAYQDSDGDGVGDLNGVTQKLDYLKDLGVTGLWLMPINRTDDHDSGYIVTDHRSVETEYGSLDDVRTLLAEAHRRGIGVIMDYVPNHSADTDPLFVNAASSRRAAYRDWYLITASRPTDWVTWSGKVPWYKVATGFYYASFNEGMPDFNWLNRDVVEYHKNNLRFWLNLGVDGFRLDAVSRLVEGGPQDTDGRPESQALVRELQDVVHEYRNRYLVCEDGTHPDATAAASVCGSAFAFGLNEDLRKLARGDTAGLGALATSLTQRPLARMGTLLANHDRFAGLRLMDEFNGDETSYRLAAASLLTLPGIPFIYYGEEVGMRGMPLADFDAGSDWPLRGPMSWAAQPTVTRNTRVGPYDYFQPAPNIGERNVAQAAQDSASLWSFYRRLLTLRRDTPALREGDFNLLAVGATALAYERRLGNESVIVAINYGSVASALSLPALVSGRHYASELAQGANAVALDTAASGASTGLSLPGRSAQVFRATLP